MYMIKYTPNLNHFYIVISFFILISFLTTGKKNHAVILEHLELSDKLFCWVGRQCLLSHLNIFKPKSHCTSTM